MKIFTAKEARAITAESINEDDVAKVIRGVNKRIKERAAIGQLKALIGFNAEDFGPLARITTGERAEVIEGLRSAGYTVDDCTLGSPYFTVSWKTHREDEE